jgi:hypothetical protein
LFLRTFFLGGRVTLPASLFAEPLFGSDKAWLTVEAEAFFLMRGDCVDWPEAVLCLELDAPGLDDSTGQAFAGGAVSPRVEGGLSERRLKTLEDG